MSDVDDELESLRRENARLRKLLKLTDAEAAPARGAQAAWFDRSPGPVDASSSPQSKVHFFAALFGARKDVYAIRWENARSGKSGWMPAVEGGWRKGTKSSDHRYLPLTPEVLAAHLTGDIHIGLYPMLPGDQTCWLAADFDGPAAMLDALAYLKAARAVGAPATVEVGTRREAHRAANREEQKVLAGSWHDSSLGDITFREYVETEWLPNKHVEALLDRPGFCGGSGYWIPTRG